jgi:hypothetical protein
MGSFFVGSGGNPPSTQALLRAIMEVWPLLPGIEAHLVGKGRDRGTDGVRDHHPVSGRDVFRFALLGFSGYRLDVFVVMVGSAIACNGFYFKERGDDS